MCISWLRAAITKYHRLAGLTTEIYFLKILEARVQDQGVGRVVSFKASLLGLQTAVFSLCLHIIFPLCMLSVT